MTRREIRVVTAGLGLVLGSFLAFRVAPDALHRVRMIHEDLAAKRVLVERMRATLATRSQLGDSISLLAAAAPQVLKRVFSGGEVQTAVRDLVARTTVIISRHETRLNRVQPNRDSLRVERLRRVSGLAVFEADTPGMVAVLADLARDPAIHVDSVQVENQSAWEFPEAVANRVPEQLRVTVHIHGWLVADSSVPRLSAPIWDDADSNVGRSSR